MRKCLRISKRTKLLTRLASFQSDAGWTLDEVITLLEQNGWKRVGGKGSHRTYIHPTYPAPIVLAVHGSKIKSGYIREIREAFEAIKKQQQQKP